jgi:hypothetical protein
MRFAPPSADRIREIRNRDWELTQPHPVGHESSLAKLIENYVRGGGSQADHVIRGFRAKIDELAATQAVIVEGQSIFDRYGQILPQHLKRFCPEYVDAYCAAGVQDFETHELFPAGPNEHYDASLPPPMDMVSHHQRRPALRAYSSQNWQLFLAPTGYQLWNPDRNYFCPSASPRMYSKLVTSAPVLPVADHIVIIQDRYPGENFAHFLFDWIPRLGLFLESGLEPTENCIFAMGGVLDKFRSLLLRAVSETYGVEPGQFFFPEDGVNLRTEGKIYWFSDQIETYMHPAQMVHPRSIEVIRKISSAIEIADGPFDRIYISRGDTGRRRVSNEDQIWEKLSRYGFEMVRLADHSIENQVALIRGAKHIVGPHGMGLSLVSLHTGSPTLFELHNPEVGTDAFALMARAMGFRYDFLLGTPVRNGLDDFDVPILPLRRVLGQFGLAPTPRPAWRRNLIPASATFAGTWSPGAQDEMPATISRDVPELFVGNAVMRHTRSNPDTRKESNCGNWWGIKIEPSRIYTATCWVWIPTLFDGREVVLSLGEWSRQRWVTADINKRDVWQRLRTTVTTPADATQCAIVLRVQASHGSVVYSTCWQLEKNPGPTDYIATS